MEPRSKQEVQQRRLSTRLRPHYSNYKEFVIVVLKALDPADDRGERGYFNAVDIAINNFEGVSILKYLRQDSTELCLSNFVFRGYVFLCFSQEQIAI